LSIVIADMLFDWMGRIFFVRFLMIMTDYLHLNTLVLGHVFFIFYKFYKLCCSLS